RCPPPRRTEGRRSAALVSGDPVRVRTGRRVLHPAAPTCEALDCAGVVAASELHPLPFPEGVPDRIEDPRPVGCHLGIVVTRPAGRHTSASGPAPLLSALLAAGSLAASALALSLALALTLSLALTLALTLTLALALTLSLSLTSALALALSSALAFALSGETALGVAELARGSGERLLVGSGLKGPFGDLRRPLQGFGGRGAVSLAGGQPSERVGCISQSLGELGIDTGEVLGPRLELGDGVRQVGLVSRLEPGRQIPHLGGCRLAFPDGLLAERRLQPRQPGPLGQRRGVQRLGQLLSGLPQRLEGRFDVFGLAEIGDELFERVGDSFGDLLRQLLRPVGLLGDRLPGGAAFGERHVGRRRSEHQGDQGDDREPRQGQDPPV